MTPPPAAEIRRYKYATAVEMMRNGARMKRGHWPLLHSVTFSDLASLSLEDTLAGDWIEI